MWIIFRVLPLFFDDIETPAFLNFHLVKSEAKFVMAFKSFLRTSKTWGSSLFLGKHVDCKLASYTSWPVTYREIIEDINILVVLRDSCQWYDLDS